MKCLEQKAYSIILATELRELGAMSREPRMLSVSLSGSIFFFIAHSYETQ